MRWFPLRVEFIAEVSSNHNGDLDRCLRFIDVAKECGFTAVKFQLFKVKKLFSPEALRFDPALLDREKWELPVEFLPHISQRAKRLGLKFICTPFYLSAVDELLPFVDAYKVASYELLWGGLLERIAATGKPVIISTGMATLREVVDAVNLIVKGGGKDITILHCVSSYPAPVGECNLSAIETMRRSISVSGDVSLRFGWSDHSVKEGVILRAVHRWGAEVVEVHFDLDEKGDEYAFGHCWLPQRAKGLIEMVRDGFLSDGDGEKMPRKIELDERMWRADPEDGLRPLKITRRRLRRDD